MTISVDYPILLMAQTQAQQLTLTLANPKNEALNLHVSINGQYTCKGCTRIVKEVVSGFL
jgi:hypothetical protein